MAILETLLGQESPTVLLLFTLPLLLLTTLLYKSLTNPLNSIPGPWICTLTPLWSYYHSYKGDESTLINSLHKLHGPIIRIAPNEILIADGTALNHIYSEKGGFFKAECYRNFDSEGHATIFSGLDGRERAKRAKSVMPMFSTGKLREGKAVFEGCVQGFVEKLREGKNRGKRMEVLDIGRRLAVDVVCEYLFGEDYGGLSEMTEEEGKLSATGYVDSIVEVGRFFFLPPWLFKIMFEWYVWARPGIEDLGRAEKVDGFTMPLVRKAKAGKGGKGTYQDRLLKAGIEEHETDVQMKDVIFAGTDTSAMNIATIVWNLAKYPECYKKLQQEVAEAEEKAPDYNTQNLKYLDGVIREGLRTSLANATRFPRQVPPGGFTYQSRDGQSYHLPGGTNGGMQPFTLHFNPEVFPDPHSFKPERWENATPEMLSDYIPFGLGPRQCIARNLAMVELVYAVRALARECVLEGAKVVEKKIEGLEWFKSKVIGGKIEVEW